MVLDLRLTMKVGCRETAISYFKTYAKKDIPKDAFSILVKSII